MKWTRYDYSFYALDKGALIGQLGFINQPVLSHSLVDIKYQYPLRIRVFLVFINLIREITKYYM